MPIRKLFPVFWCFISMLLTFSKTGEAMTSVSISSSLSPSTHTHKKLVAEMLKGCVFSTEFHYPIPLYHPLIYHQNSSLEIWTMYLSYPLILIHIPRTVLLYWTFKWQKLNVLLWLLFPEMGFSGQYVWTSGHSWNLNNLPYMDWNWMCFLLCPFLWNGFSMKTCLDFEEHFHK